MLVKKNEKKRKRKRQQRKFAEFVLGEQFEKRFINQGKYEFRDINQTLDLALELLKILPPEELDKL